MNGILTPDQIADLAGISQICEELGADPVPARQGPRGYSNRSTPLRTTE